MTTSSKPTIGRIVHFKVREGTICPAIITAVLDDGLALHIFDPFGGSYSMMQIREGELPGQWFWPPKV